MTEVRNKRVTIAGLGRFGGQIAVAKWAVEQGASRVLVTDSSSAKKLAPSIAQLEGLPIEFRFENQLESDFTDTDLVIASPAIPPHSPFLKAARAANVPVTTEIRLFVERCPAKIIGVTGTKGKSTTSAMIGEILKTKFKTWVGGNIGKPLITELHQIDPSDLVVLELSSFMLEYLGEMQWSPHVATVTFVSQDHLDWHGSKDEYLRSKQNIVRYQRADDVAVLCEEYESADGFRELTRAKVVSYGMTTGKPFELALSGQHNQLNAQAAFVTANVLGITWDEAQKVLKDFRGLPHRLQVVHEANGVKYVNDSIATIPEAAIAALESFPQKQVIQIVGGSKKKDPPIVELCAKLNERAKAVLCIGETGPKIAEELAKTTSQVGAAVYACHDLETAMREAKAIAVAGDVVLLSTGYASYDQFANFEGRGEMFAELARKN